VSAFIRAIDKLYVGDKATAITQILYVPEVYHEGLFDHYSIQKPTALTHWLPQRQAQFLAGRLAVKEHISELPCSDVQIPIGQHRQPVWPDQYTGSISHSEKTSIAAVKKTLTHQSGLGVDIQALIDNDTQEKITHTILSTHENALIQQEKQLSESMLFTLIFSAKESFFKAVFNTVGRYFDFDAMLLISIDTGGQKLRFEVAETLCPLLAKGHTFDVSFMIVNSAKPHVITSCQWDV